jgi:hypothetical protein
MLENHPNSSVLGRGYPIIVNAARLCHHLLFDLQDQTKA